MHVCTSYISTNTCKVLLFWWEAKKFNQMKPFTTSSGIANEETKAIKGIARFVVERRWRLGATHWGPKHHVWYRANLCYSKIARWRRFWCRRSNGKWAKMDLGPWGCNCNTFLAENVAFCMNSKLLAWAKILIVLQLWVDIWSTSDGHRYSEHMNGLGIIHSHRKCGYVLTFFQFIQVSLSHSVCV